MNVRIYHLTLIFYNDSDLRREQHDRESQFQENVVINVCKQFKMVRRTRSRVTSKYGENQCSIASFYNGFGPCNT
jgi:hypothetical protein